MEDASMLEDVAMSDTTSLPSLNSDLPVPQPSVECDDLPECPGKDWVVGRMLPAVKRGCQGVGPQLQLAL